MYLRRKTILITSMLLCTVLVITGCGANTSRETVDPLPTETPEADISVTPVATEVPSPTAVPIDYKTATIKDMWGDSFYVGAVLNGAGVANEAFQELVKTNFNSFTMENEMKPDSLLDYNTNISDPQKYNENPAISFARADAGLQFAKENGLKMRGHTLVWHSQTPRWFFTEGYSFEADAPFVSRDMMLKRMENYIRQVMEYVQTNYPDVIYAWDVVNEAINPGDKQPDGLRTESMWYQVIGEDYIEKAFEYARKYAAPGTKLFYNDYNTEESAKVVQISKLAKKLIAQGTIDGIGMQTHIKMDSPSLTMIDESVRTYAKLGLELQVTELDVDNNVNTEEELQAQATRYKRLFLYFKKWKEAGIKLTSVTFWGTTDDRSWLNKPNLPSYPLLFDKDLQKKPSYYGVLQDPEIKLY